MVDTYPDGPSFLSALDDPRPGCVLLDMRMPGMTGVEVQQAFNARGFDWPVVVLTAANEVRLAVETMKNGAFEYLQKPFDSEELRRVIGDAFQALEARAEEAARTSDARRKVGSLSAREREVLQGLLAGMPSKLIAYELDLSTRTVEIYRGKMMDKLGVRSVSAAVRLALAAGVTPLVERDAG
ncbi:response regulator transcription factor [Phenylobacterium sp. J367]|uniref:response regulator transcription factor n=1 Tax=Phenylobacterium sp. J367 TaxID=2898435 RepID=UPI002151DB2E|nr:response regulator [Phenylobacterium sp. J367]MCR5878146.1 LuxR C-terminal-related transcriptional regulator [Phenylobacterium sp. J367]